MNFEERIQLIKQTIEQTKETYIKLTGQLAECEFWFEESKKEIKEDKKKK